MSERRGIAIHRDVLPCTGSRDVFLALSYVVEMRAHLSIGIEQADESARQSLVILLREQVSSVRSLMYTHLVREEQQIIDLWLSMSAAQARA